MSLIPPDAAPLAPVFDLHPTTRIDATLPAPRRVRRGQKQVATAIVYCEANFGDIDGKTANGLVRHSEKYRILSVIDSEKTGLDTGVVLGEKPNAIPVCRDLAHALAHAGGTPDFFIFGIDHDVFVDLCLEPQDVCTNIPTV